jgi:hypothetical protein
MKRFFCLLAVLLLLPAVAGAQDVPSIAPALPPVPGQAQPLTGAEGEVSATQQCFNVINHAPYTVHGSFVSDTYVNDGGVTARHRANFRLEEGEMTNFCSTGPFYEGGRLELVLRTLVPIFSCKTRIDGDIVINGRKKAEGGTDTWAVCR